VDVVATDKRGRRILDLAREELQIEVDGRKQSLDYFAPPQGIAPEDVEALEIPPNVRPAPGGTVFLVLDRATLDGRDLNRVIGSFGAFVSAPGLAGKTFVVASFAGAPVIHAPGTTDLDQVLRALEDAGRTGARGEIRRLERQHLQDDVRSATPAIAELLAVQLQAFEEQEISQQAAFLAMIQDLVATSADSDQPNTLLIASEGFSAEPARYLREIAKEVAGRQSGTLLSRLDAAPTRYLYVLDELEKLAQTLQERRVTAYTLIPTSGFSMGSWSPAHRSSGRSPAASPREDMDLTESAANAATLADSTGGSRIPISTDLKERIGAIALDRRASYSLGFTTGPEAGVESHEIRISTSRRGVSLRHRASYRRLSQSEQWQSALAAAARAGIVNAALPIAVRVEPAATRPADDGRSRRVPVVLDIPLAQLSFRPSPDRSSDVTTLTFQLAVNNAAGALVRGPEEAIEISVPHADLERARADSWTHRVEVELPAGPAGIGALLIERSTGAWATASCTVSADD
jgi:VWFA-related protein